MYHKQQHLINGKKTEIVWGEVGEQLECPKGFTGGDYQIFGTDKNGKEYVAVASCYDDKVEEIYEDEISEA